MTTIFLIISGLVTAVGGLYAVNGYRHAVCRTSPEPRRRRPWWALLIALAFLNLSAAGPGWVRKCGDSCALEWSLFLAWCVLVAGLSVAMEWRARRLEKAWHRWHG